MPTRVGTALKTLIGNLNRALRRAKAAKETVKKEVNASKSGKKSRGRVLAVATYSVKEVEGHANQAKKIGDKLLAAEIAHNRERKMRAAQLESETNEKKVRL